jgi:translation initiation factor IF-1
MVKNLNGGKKSKNMARKNVIGRSAPKSVRLSDNEAAVYAQVTKYIGNGQCHVMCSDLKTRLCIIRGKFKGRGRRDNKVEMGTWVLVGLRTWASSGSDNNKKKEDCDLMEVYTELDKQQLRDREPDVNWSDFTTTNTVANTKNDETDDYLTFNSDTSKGEYDDIMNTVKSETNNTPSEIIGLDMIGEDGDDEDDLDIDIDDI